MTRMPKPIIHLTSPKQVFIQKASFWLGMKHFPHQMWRVFAPSQRHYLHLTAWNPFCRKQGQIFFLSFCSVVPLKSLHDNPLQGKLSQELGNGPEIAARHKPIKCIPNWLLLARLKDALFSEFMSAFYFPELWWKYRNQVQYELVKLL